MAVEFSWNSTGIPSEYCRRFCPNLPHVFQNYSDEIPLIFWRKEPEFLWNFCSILMGFFVVFSRIWVVFWCNFSGILMEFQSKKQCERSYLENLTGIFAKFFMYFLILLYPKRAWKNPCTVGTSLVFWWKFHSSCIANKSPCQKKPKYINEKHYIIIIFSWN